MGWHIYEKLLEKVANYSPFVGKIWILFIFMFRLIIVTSVGDTIYDDEQSEFECNTNDPGCRQFCFTKFTPVSQIRFFAMQLLFVGTPSMIFIVYTLHRITMHQPQLGGGDQVQPGGGNDNNDVSYRKRRRGAKRRRRRRKIRYLRDHLTSDQLRPNELPRYNDVVVHPETKDQLITKHVHLSNGKLKASKEGLLTSDSSTDSLSSSDEENFEKPGASNASNKAETESNEKAKKVVKTRTVYNPEGSDEIFTTTSIQRAYFTQAFLRMVIEGGFLYLQYQLYGIEVHWLYDCTGEPCTKEIACYVSRPREKTYLLLFMYAMAGLSLLLNFIEIGSIVYEQTRKKMKNKKDDTKKHHLTAMPLTQILTSNNRQNPGMYQRAINLNTFPNLGPYPLPRDNSVGGGSTRDVIQSDTGGYYY